jgi:hypothetical protein
MALSLSAAAAVVCEHRNPYRRDEGLLTYQRDLAAPFGVTVDEGLLAEGGNIPFVELAERLLRAVPRPPVTPEMIIVSYGLPDCYPFTTIASHVDHLLGGGSCCFAVSEQGLRAPFTALRIAAAFARSGRCATLALLVLEQGTFPQPHPLADRDTLPDSGALLLFDDDGSYEVAGVWTGPDLGDVLDAAARAAPAGDRLLVAGPWTDPRVIESRAPSSHRVEPGSYCTSVWLDLARNHGDWALRYECLVLCDTDPRTHRSQALLLRGTAASAAVHEQPPEPSRGDPS